VIDHSRRPEPAPAGRSDRTHYYKIIKGGNPAVWQPAIQRISSHGGWLSSFAATSPTGRWRALAGIGSAISVMPIAAIDDQPELPMFACRIGSRVAGDANDMAIRSVPETLLADRTALLNISQRHRVF